jgi:hypothetical protein
MHEIFYVYVLFDWLGIPRYIGKGKDNRWLLHERYTDLDNPMKNEFIERTWIMLDEIPKVKIRENVSEEEAIAVEMSLVAAIGRSDRGQGPLTNLTDGGEGTSGRKHSLSSRMKMSAKSAAYQASLTPAQRSERARLREANIPPEERSARSRRARASIPIERQSELGRQAVAAVSVDELTFRLNGNFTFEQRSKRLKDAFAKMTPEERSNRSRNGGFARMAKLTPEERSAQSKQAGLAQNMVSTPEQRSERARRTQAKRTAKQRQETMRKTRESQTPEQRSENTRRAWITRRAKLSKGDKQ